MTQLVMARDTDNIIENVYEACARRVEKQAKRNYLGMSEIGSSCEAKLWLKYNGYQGNRIEGRIARVFDMGNSVETRVIADLIEAGYEIDGQQLSFEDFDGKFKGHCDGIIYKVTQKPHILEIKSANAESFKNFQRKGIGCKPAYEAQVHCYMGYAGLTRALFVVENKNNQQLYMERVHFNSEIFQTMREKAWRILHLTTRPIGLDTECFWCDYKNSGYCGN
jgi:uncharacterized protein YfbU (UPF0304 family)